MAHLIRAPSKPLLNELPNRVPTQFVAAFLRTPWKCLWRICIWSGEASQLFESQNWGVSARRVPWGCSGQFFFLGHKSLLKPFFPALGCIDGVSTKRIFAVCQLTFHVTYKAVLLWTWFASSSSRVGNLQLVLLASFSFLAKHQSALFGDL